MATVVKRRWAGPDHSERTAWRVDYRDHDGKRRAKQFPRKRDADAFRQAVERELHSGIHLPDSESPTVADAGQAFLQAGHLRGWERSTALQMANHVNNHIIPKIGTMKLSRLRHHDVERFAAHLVESNSRAQARNVFQTFRAVLKHAKRAHLAEGVVIHRQRNYKLEIGTDIPSVHDLKAILKHAEPGRPHTLIMVAALTGLRASELRGLRWSDIEDGRLHVRQRIDRWNRVAPPKSAAGRRTVPFGPQLSATLQEWEEQ